MKKMLSMSLLIVFGFFLKTAVAATLTIPMYLTTPTGKAHSIGNIVARDSKKGLLMIPNLHGLPPGAHGIHIHENPSCDQAGMASGGHLDPMKTEKHLGPYSLKGHLGDLPKLSVDKKGDATKSILAPKLTTELLENHAIVIHAGGDNYSDQPEKLGGGGARIACGVVPNK